MGRNQLAGFTLIEILLAVMLLAVTAGLAVPAMFRLQEKWLLKNSAYAVWNLMQQAQTRAMTSAEELRLISDADGKSLWLEHKTGETYVRLAGKLGQTVDIPAGLKVRTEDFPVAFLPDGSIGHAELSVCLEKDCYLVSSREQYANVSISEWTEQ
ncbi:MAG: prepilin-type N-terminal cleavage/methylation domain-containing protein [Candidatus Omnitrophica bacterium]|nr:prepilin-type N-terminal cleavage/methylation domain-containing protein [Candidatus Omnitrophota bacterium]